MFSADICYQILDASAQPLSIVMLAGELSRPSPISVTGCSRPGVNAINPVVNPVGMPL